MSKIRFEKLQFKKLQYMYAYLLEICENIKIDVFGV